MEEAEEVLISRMLREERDEGMNALFDDGGEMMAEGAAMSLLEEAAGMDSVQQKNRPHEEEGIQRQSSYQELSVRRLVEDVQVEAAAVAEPKKEKLSPALVHLCRQMQERIGATRDECHELRQEASDLLEYSNAKINRVTRYLGVLADKARKLDMVVNETESRIAPLKRERKRLFNDLLSIKGNLRVFVRARPPFDKEGAMATAFPDDYTIRITPSGSGGSVTSPRKDFEYDRVFGPHISQADLFPEVQQFVQSALDGYNSCILAYGQTGAGKTYTMEGTSQNRGIYYRSFQELLLLANQNTTPTSKYQFFVTMIEIYNEQIRDLLTTKPGTTSTASPKRREFTQADEGSVVCSVLEEEVVNASDFVNVLRQGFRNRTGGSPRNNDRINRSHLLVTVHVEFTESRHGGEKQCSKLTMVDMAGSDRPRADASGDRLTESLHVNKSISTLGDVLSCLTSKKGVPPFKGSKLTHVLADSLGGDAKTLIIVNVAPSYNDVQETISSLNFGARAKNVELGLGSKDTIKKFRDMANEARKDLYEREKESSEMQSQMIVLKQVLKESDSQCFLLFSELQKAWAVSTRLQTELDSREMEIIRLEAENNLREDQKKKGDDLSRAEVASLRLDLEEEKRRAIEEKETEKRRALADQDAEKRRALAEKEAEKKKTIAEKEAEKWKIVLEKEAEKWKVVAEKDAAIEVLQTKLQRMEKALEKATGAARIATEQAAEKAAQRITDSEETRRAIEELAEQKAAELARADKQVLLTAREEIERVKEEGNRLVVELKSESIRVQSECQELRKDLLRKDQLIQQLRDETQQLEQQKERQGSSGPLKDIEFEGAMAVGDASSVKMLDKHAAGEEDGTLTNEQDRRSFIPPPVSVPAGGGQKVEERPSPNGAAAASPMTFRGGTLTTAGLLGNASPLIKESLNVNSRTRGEAEMREREAAPPESPLVSTPGTEESVPIHSVVVLDVPAVKTTPAGDFLTRSLREFDPSNIESRAEVSEGANKLLMLVLAAVMKAGAAREHEMLAEIRPAVFSFLRRMDREGVMDTMLVSHVRMLYIRALLGRSPELSGVQVPSVECFLERGGSASRRQTPRTSPSPSPNPSPRPDGLVRGFRVELRQANSWQLRSLLRKWRHHVSTGRLKDISEEARNFAIGNKALAKLFAHTQPIDLMHKIRDWLAENYEFLSQELVVEGNPVNQLDLLRTAIYDGWMTGLGVPQSPNTDALGQLLLGYTKKVYEAHLEQLKDLAYGTAQEEAEDLAHMHKLMMNLEAMNTQRRKALQQMKNDIALLSYEENSIPLKVDSGGSHDDRILSLRTLSNIAKQCEEIRRDVVKGPAKKKVLLSQLDELEQRTLHLMPVDREVAKRYIRDGRKEIERDTWRRFSLPENVSGEEESSGELSLTSAQWVADGYPVSDLAPSSTRINSISMEGGEGTSWSTIRFNNKQSSIVVKCSITSSSELVVRVHQQPMNATGTNQKIEEGVEMQGDQVSVMPVPSKLVGLSMEQIDRVLATLPDGMQQLVVPRIKTPEGIRARYTRLYDTLAAKVGSAVQGGGGGGNRERERTGARVANASIAGSTGGTPKSGGFEGFQQRGRSVSFPLGSGRKRLVVPSGNSESRNAHAHAREDEPLLSS